MIIGRRGFVQSLLAGAVSFPIIEHLEPASAKEERLEIENNLDQSEKIAKRPERTYYSSTDPEDMSTGELYLYAQEGDIIENLSTNEFFVIMETNYNESTNSKMLSTRTLIPGSVRQSLHIKENDRYKLITSQSQIEDALKTSKDIMKSRHHIRQMNQED